jgi:hypothetical protein
VSVPPDDRFVNAERVMSETMAERAVVGGAGMGGLAAAKAIALF